jgi:hypothetical protein
MRHLSRAAYFEHLMTIWGMRLPVAARAFRVGYTFRLLRQHPRACLNTTTSFERARPLDATISHIS